tara:strand:+ start:9283 stop:9471 length:189 start_codon:yes stop_codon:yes gene_type:complete
VNIWLAISILLAILVAKVGEADYNARVDEEKRYCQMVAEGTWADYKQTYKEQCLEIRNSGLL